MAALRNNEIEPVVVPAFSRFERSTTHLHSALSEFKAKNVGLVGLSEKIDASPPQRDLKERGRAGLANARANGKHIGRAKKRDSDLIRKLRRAGMSYRQISEIARCSHGAVHAGIVALEKEEKERLLHETQEAEKKAQQYQQIDKAIAVATKQRFDSV